MARDYVQEMKAKHAGNLREEALHLRARGDKRSIREADELEAWARKIERLVDPETSTGELRARAHEQLALARKREGEALRLMARADRTVAKERKGRA